MTNTNYNYREAMYDDIKEYISENINLFYSHWYVENCTEV